MKKMAQIYPSLSLPSFLHDHVLCNDILEFLDHVQVQTDPNEKTHAREKSKFVVYDNQSFCK